MAIYGGFVIACDEGNCAMRFFQVSGTWQNAEREARKRGWMELARRHRCPDHAAAFRSRN